MKVDSPILGGTLTWSVPGGEMWVWACFAARGQVPPATGNVQMLHASIDAQQMLWTDDARIAPNGAFRSRTYLSYTGRPLIWAFPDGTTATIVGTTWQLDAIASVSYGGARLGLDIPILLGGQSDAYDGGGAGLGEVAVDGRFVVVDAASPSGMGLAIATRVGFPTATVTQPLGSDGVSWEVTGIAEADLGPVRVAANLGTRGGPPIRIGDVEIGEQLVGRLGAALPVGDHLGASAELAMRVAYASPPDIGVPVEFLVGGWARLSDSVSLRAGVGTGLVPGVGAPQGRVMAGLVFEPDREPPQARPDDRDGDGIVEDACPDSAEDLDGFLDGDGCPEPVQLRVRIQDGYGATVVGAYAWLACDNDTDLRTHADEVVEVRAGTCTLDAAAPHWSVSSRTVRVDSGRPTDAVILLSPEAPVGRLEIEVYPGDVGAGWMSGDSTAPLPVDPGGSAFALPPGTLHVRVVAPGYAPVIRTAEVVAGEVARLAVRLLPE